MPFTDASPKSSRVGPARDHASEQSRCLVVVAAQTVVRRDGGLIRFQFQRLRTAEGNLSRAMMFPESLTTGSELENSQGQKRTKSGLSDIAFSEMPSSELCAAR